MNTLNLGTVPSPCVSLCKINLDTEQCEGCFRTLEEIINWGTSSDEVKREVWKKIELRKLQQAQ